MYFDSYTVVSKGTYGDLSGHRPCTSKEVKRIPNYRRNDKEVYFSENEIGVSYEYKPYIVETRYVGFVFRVMLLLNEHVKPCKAYSTLYFV
jgi:hypothetical protein